MTAVHVHIDREPKAEIVYDDWKLSGGCFTIDQRLPRDVWDKMKAAGAWYISRDDIEADRESMQIEHARHYARMFADAGVPGHGQFVLIAKLADHIDWLEQVFYDLQRASMEDPARKD